MYIIIYKHRIVRITCIIFVGDFTWLYYYFFIYFCSEDRGVMLPAFALAITQLQYYRSGRLPFAHLKIILHCEFVIALLLFYMKRTIVVIHLIRFETRLHIYYIFTAACACNSDTTFECLFGDLRSTYNTYPLIIIILFTLLTF